MENDFKKEDVDALGQLLLQGPMNITAYRIFVYCREGNKEAAESQYHWDGDKIRPYPEYYKAVHKLLGCRTHLKHDCSHEWCK